MTRDEQRRKANRQQEVAIRLELQLRLLLQQRNVVDFQQLVQFAPAEMKMRLMDSLTL